MCINEGIGDRFLRAAVGLMLVVIGGFLIASGSVTTTTPMIVTVVGGVLLGTSIIGFCPLYTLLRINTGCKKD